MQHSLELPAVAIKNAFAGLSKVIINKTTLPVLGCVRVEADANGITRFQATDLNSFATCQVQGSPGGFPACLVPFDALNRIAKGAKNPIRLVCEDGKLSVQSRLGTATVAQSLATHPLDEWPAVPQVPEPVPAGGQPFTKAVREALECASSDSSRYVITGACLDLSDPACHSVVGTDGRHLFSANTFHFDLPKSVIIPPRKFFAWPGFTQDGDWRVGLSLDKDGDPEWVELKSDHWSFITKPIEGTYPNWRQVVPTEDGNVTRVSLNEEAIDLMLEALPHLPGKDDRFQPVSLIAENGSFHLSAIGGDDKKSTEVPIPGASVTGNDARILLDRTFVSKALRFGLSTFELSDELSPIVFIAPGRKLVAMPLHPDRVNPAPAVTTPAPETEPQTAAPATPSAEQPEETQTETSNTMPTQTNITPPRRGNLQPNGEGTNSNHNGATGQNGQNGSALAGAITQVETVKTGLRDVIIELNTTIDLLRAAEREKKASFKEVESVRATLRSLQKVAI